ncbi:hypothetical protein C8J57DRAFT_1718180 [Mycena rebaudengoi]|nr:hypothetical protein C8J57DRAFT_1718180 [Mycena rebaudengoi]
MISFLLSPFFWLILARLGVDAQLVSPTWRKPNITTSTTDRIRIIGAALEQSLNHVGADGQFTDSADGGSGRAGPFYLQMAEFDIVTGQSKYEDTVQKFLAFTQSTGANFSDEKYGRRYTLTLDNVNSGKTNIKNYPITKSCDGVTMAGGTFWSNDTTDPDVASSPTGNFLILSALLAEATSDPMYVQAASDAADFIRAHFYTGSHLIQNTISARQNDSCEVDTYTDPEYSGLVIEGLSILFSITKKASLQLLLKDLITVIPHTTWQQVDGILVNDQDFFPGDLVKGLGVAYARNVTSPELQNWMKAYIAVQFNALVDLSTNGTNIYAAAWQGPPSLTFDGGAQTDAIQVLLSAISFEDDSQPSSSTNGSPSPTGAPPPPPFRLRKIIHGWPNRWGCYWRHSSPILHCLRILDVTPMVFAPYGDHPFSEPLTVLAPQRAKANDDNFSLSPTSASVGDQLDVAALGGQAEYAWNSQQWRRTLEPQSVVPTAQLIALLHERLRNEGNQDQPPEYPQSR